MDKGVEDDMRYGQVALITATPDEDMKENTDYRLGSLRVAYRRRRISLKRYGQISIRRARMASGAMTEWHKILNGSSQAHLYVFEFLDAWVVCTLADIREAMEQDRGESVRNNDHATAAYYIEVADLPHLLIEKAT
jgi:hypothetical protein